MGFTLVYTLSEQKLFTYYWIPEKETDSGFYLFAEINIESETVQRCFFIT